MNKLATAHRVRLNLDKRTGQPKNLKPSLLTIAVATALYVNASPGLAQNIEIESSLGGSVTGERVNNTTNLFADGISDSGSTILLDANDDVSANRISNSATLDAIAEGIELYAENGEVEANTVNNSGSIFAGDDGILVRSEESALRANIIENSGLIEAGDDGIDLMSEGDLSGNDVINRGRIIAGDNGIELGIECCESGRVFGNDVTNSGSIVAEDDGIQIEGGNGVYGNTVTNSGSISTSDDDGIDLNSNGSSMYGNLIVNSGRIEASDKGITLDSDEGAFYANTIENSGLIVSSFDDDDFVSIRMAGEYRDGGGDAYGASNELTLRAPAYVAGEFWLERRAETDVLLVSGPSHSVRWVFEDEDYDCDGGCTYDDNGARSFTTSGPVPWFRNPAGGTTLDDADDEFATIDPSAFAAAAHQLADLSGMASAMANDALSPFAPKRNGFWASARGSRMQYDGDGRATLDQDTHTSGFAGGYVRDIGNGAAGITLGYGKSDLEVGSAWKDYYSHSYDNKAKGYFAGLHGVASLGPVRIGVGVSGGRMEHDDKRFINDNLERDGQSYATADYDSRWYAPELSLSVPLSVGAKTTITPNIHGRYMVQKIDGYSERGSNADATVAKRTIKVDEISAGIDFTRQFDNSSLTARVGYVKRNLRGSDEVRVSMIGDTNDVPYFGQNVKAAYVGLGYNLAIKERVALEITGSYLSGSDVKGGSVGASLKIKF